MSIQVIFFRKIVYYLVYQRVDKIAVYFTLVFILLRIVYFKFGVIRLIVLIVAYHLKLQHFIKHRLPPLFVFFRTIFGYGVKP